MRCFLTFILFLGGVLYLQGHSCATAGGAACTCASTACCRSCGAAISACCRSAAANNNSLLPTGNSPQTLQLGKYGAASSADEGNFNFNFGSFSEALAGDSGDVWSSNVSGTSGWDEEAKSKELEASAFFGDGMLLQKSWSC